MTQMLKIHEAAALLASQFGTGETAWYVRLCRAAVQGRLNLRHADGFPVEPRTIAAEPAIASHVRHDDLNGWLESQGLAALPAPLTVADSAQDNRRGISTDELCAAFDGLRWSSLKWRETISKRAPAWLAGARLQRGTPGNAAKPAIWCPISVAEALLRRRHRGPAVTVGKVSSAFNMRPELCPFRDAWRQYREDHPEIG